MTIFDKTAVEAAAKGMYDMGNKRFGDDTWDGAAPEAKSHYIEGARAALSAAEASMRERGRLMEDGDWWAGKTPDYKGPVTIIRKKTP